LFNRKIIQLVCCIGIDFITNQKEQDLSPPLLASLFTDEGFYEFQAYSLKRFNKKWITYGAVLSTIILLLSALWIPFFLFQADEWIDNFPELAENGMYILFEKNQRGITPGQFAAWYDGDELMGSGIIS